MLPGCNAVNTCGPSRGCDQGHAECCHLLAVDNATAKRALPTTKAVPRAAPLKGPAALMLGPPLPQACAGLPRVACNQCLTSKDPATCTQCVRDVLAQQDVFDKPTGWRSHPGARTVWSLQKGVPTPPPTDANLGCKRCTETLAPQTCSAGCVRKVEQSSCWPCVVPPSAPYWLRSEAVDSNYSLEECMSCTRNAGPQWAHECL